MFHSVAVSLDHEFSAGNEAHGSAARSGDISWSRRLASLCFNATKHHALQDHILHYVKVLLLWSHPAIHWGRTYNYCRVLLRRQTSIVKPHYYVRGTSSRNLSSARTKKRKRKKEATEKVFNFSRINFSWKRHYFLTILPNNMHSLAISHGDVFFFFFTNNNSS